MTWHPWHPSKGSKLSTYGNSKWCLFQAERGTYYGKAQRSPHRRKRALNGETWASAATCTCTFRFASDPLSFMTLFTVIYISYRRSFKASIRSGNPESARKRSTAVAALLYPSLPSMCLLHNVFP